jgi:hypothetical protein
MSCERGQSLPTRYIGMARCRGGSKKRLGVCNLLNCYNDRITSSRVIFEVSGCVLVPEPADYLLECLVLSEM